jgi:1,4-alpha-glucan branching enzyme
MHKGLHDLVREFNHFYLQSKALWERDFDWQGFEWVDFSDAQNSVISYLRKSEHQYLLCVHNFTPQYLENYWIKLKNIKAMREVFNTDSAKFGGSNKLCSQIALSGDGVGLQLAPLATMIFEIEFN